MQTHQIATGTPKGLQLIWVDDDLTDCDARLNPFRKRNIEVEAHRDGESAKRRLREQHFDVAIIDLLMPGVSGVDLISEIIDQGLLVRPVVYSGYISTKEVNDYDLLKDHGIPYFDKNVTKVEELVDAVDDLVRNQKSSLQTAKLLTRSAAGHPRSILDYDYDEFRSLSQEDRYLLTLQAEKTLSDVMSKYQQKGAVWLLFTGKESPPLVAYDYSEIPSGDEVEEICRKKNTPKLQYYMNVEIDDLVWRENCSANSRYYPLLGLRSTTSTNTRAVHFDTGSPVSLFDREIVTREFGVEIHESDDLVPFPVNNVPMAVFVKEASFYLFDSGGRGPRISIRIHVPRAWTDCPVRARYCTDACNRDDIEQRSKRAEGDDYGEPIVGSGERFICKHRWGLVGRNLLFETQLKFVLDGKVRLVSLLVE